MAKNPEKLGKREGLHVVDENRDRSLVRERSQLNVTTAKDRSTWLYYMKNDYIIHIRTHTHVHYGCFYFPQDTHPVLQCANVVRYLR